MLTASAIEYYWIYTEHTLHKRSEDNSTEYNTGHP